jgi:hypothetical protein
MLVIERALVPHRIVVRAPSISTASLMAGKAMSGSTTPDTSLARALATQPVTPAARKASCATRSGLDQGLRPTSRTAFRARIWPRR